MFFVATVVGTAQEITALVVLVEAQDHLLILLPYAKNITGLKSAVNALSKGKAEEMPTLCATIPTKLLMWECSKLTKLTGRIAAVEIRHAM